MDLRTPETSKKLGDWALLLVAIGGGLVLMFRFLLASVYIGAGTGGASYANTQFFAMMADIGNTAIMAAIPLAILSFAGRGAAASEPSRHNP